MVIVKPSMSSPPELPKLVGEIMLDVFTHKSIQPVSPDVGQNDNDRLAVLGQSTLEMAMTYAIFLQQPFYTAEDIRKRREILLSDENVRSWVKAYDMLRRLRRAPDLTIDKPEDLRVLFYSYIGALYVQNELAAIQNWVNAVVDPNGENLPLSSSPPPNQSLDLHPPAYQSGSRSPRPPSDPPPPIPSPPSSEPVRTNGASGSSTLNTITLALVNQIAAQKACQIQYDAEKTGPDHQPTWTVRCKINGAEKGVGRGKNQKVAKEEAAKQTFHVMGWGS